MDTVKNLVAGVIDKISQHSHLKYARIHESWREISGEKVGQHTQLAGIKDDQILIYVDSSAWLYQLNLNKDIYLNKIRQEFPQTKSIFFKIGKVSG